MLKFLLSPLTLSLAMVLGGGYWFADHFGLMDTQVVRELNIFIIADAGDIAPPAFPLKDQA